MVEELVVVTKDRVGLLARISEALGNAKINIESISADVVGRNAVIKLIVSDPKKGKSILRKAGFKPIASDTLVVTLEDKPGELSKVSKLLSDAGISITNVYMLGKEKGKSIIAFKVDRMAKARKVLKDYL